VQDDDAERGRDREHEHGPGLAEQHRSERQRGCGDDRRDRGVPREREDDQPDTRAGQTDERRQPKEGSARRATIFPPLTKPRKSGRQWPSIAAAPASAPATWPTASVATSAGAKPFATSSSATGSPSLGP
jgi:hypothetical protein